MGKASYLLSLPNSLYDRIIKLAKQDDQSIAAWIRQAIKEKLERREKTI